MAHCVDTLKEWTGTTNATILFDSTTDEFTHDGVFQKLRGKKNVALIATSDGKDVFGAFYSVAVTQQRKEFRDPTMFVFCFECHGRCKTPHRAAVWEDVSKWASVEFYTGPNAFVHFTVFNRGSLYLGTDKTTSASPNLSLAFRGIANDTFTGRTQFRCVRLVAVALS